MKPSHPTITLVLCALGLIVGYSANNQIVSEPNAKVTAPSNRTIHRETATDGHATAIQLPKIRSDETLETMIAQGGNATYAGLALWILDASAPDIAAYWEFRKNGGFGGDMKRLLFLNWTRLDPQAAITAVAGTDGAAIPWWAWAAHDPKAALAAAGPERIKDVARGIGEFQPEWLREHFDQIPEEFKQEALTGLMTWKEDGDHVATLDFLKKQGVDFHTRLFRTLARKDPWSAFDWLERNNKLSARDNGPVDVLLDTMKSAHPEDLERLATITPPGALKRKMENAVFENLLATAPEKALAQAKATDAPLVAAGRLAKIGASLLATDPEKAFEIGADIVTACPEKLVLETRIDTANGTSSVSYGANTAAAFLESLLIKDPGRTLDLTTLGRETASPAFRELSEKWAERDLVAYTRWVNRQTVTPIRNAAARQVVSQLSSQGNFHEAAEWAMDGETPDPNNLSILAWRWGRNNRSEASEWLESAKLPESVKGTLRTFIQSNE